MIPRAQPWTGPKVLTILDEIANALWDHREHLGPDLSTGLAGAALFFGYLSLHPDFRQFRDKAHDVLTLAIGKVEQTPFPGFYLGYVGISWCVEHLNGRIWAKEREDPNDEMDEFIMELLESGVWPGEYGLLDGLVGLGVYAMERLPLRSGSLLLERILDQLEHLAIHTDSGVAWQSPGDRAVDEPRREASPRFFNLGVAHGIPGVLCLLAGMQAAGVAPLRAGQLLERGMAWLATQFQTSPQGRYLPGWVGILDSPAAPNRISWCYGNLGSSLALLNVARLAANQGWANQALGLGRIAACHAAQQPGVKDAGLCHGSAGNMHMFNRLHRATGDPLFQKAALTYYRHVLASHRPSTGFAGFSAYCPGGALDAREPTGPDAFLPLPGLLDGAAGIGLALLAGLSNDAFDWDRFMLLSTPLSNREVLPGPPHAALNEGTR